MKHVTNKYPMWSKWEGLAHFQNISEEGMKSLNVLELTVTGIIIFSLYFIALTQVLFTTDNFIQNGVPIILWVNLTGSEPFWSYLEAGHKLK